MRVVGILNVLRALVFLISLIALVCHIVQCALLDIFQQQANIPSWTEAGHWQYLVWYVALSISVLSGAAVCAHAWCYKRAHLVQGDRFLGFVNFFPLLAAILAALFTGGPEPWTAGYVRVNRPIWSFITSCSGDDTFSVAAAASTGPAVPAIKLESSFLYERCVLSDSTWLGAALALLFWMVLACLAVLHRPASSVTADLFKEPKWGRYIPEPPPSLRSANIQIVPPPPPHHLRHSVIYNSYIPRSDKSFDSQSVSTTFSYGKHASWQYYHDEYSNTAGGYPYHHQYPSQPHHHYHQPPYFHHQPPIVPMLPMVPQMDSIDLFDAIPTEGTNAGITSDSTTMNSSNIDSDSKRNSQHVAVHEQQIQQQDYYGSRPVSYQQQELVMTPWDYQQQQQQQQQQTHDRCASSNPPPTENYSPQHYQDVTELASQGGGHLLVESVPVLRKPQQY